MLVVTPEVINAIKAAEDTMEEEATVLKAMFKGVEVAI